MTIETPIPTTTAYADGSCLGNPGPGGWAVIILDPNGKTRALSGRAAHTTNNRQELTAAIAPFKALGDDAPAVLFLDSQYVIKGVNEWRTQWEARGWRNSQGKPVANADLCPILFAEVDARPNVTLRWVRGHPGDRLNGAVDRLARGEAERARLAAA